MTTPPRNRTSIESSFDEAPIVGVVRTDSREEAARQARTLIASGLRLIEVTFTVPGAPELVRELLSERAADADHAVGMGTVTTAGRAREAVAAGSEFLISPNVSSEVAAIAREANLFLVMGALSSTEIVAARQLGADLVKVYPLPPVGGPRYLATVRGPLGDIPMLAAGGFAIEEIPDYRRAGARAFGIGAPLLGSHDPEECRRRVRQALLSARGEEGG